MNINLNELIAYAKRLKTTGIAHDTADTACKLLAEHHHQGGLKAAAKYFDDVIAQDGSTGETWADLRMPFQLFRDSEYAETWRDTSQSLLRIPEGEVLPADSTIMLHGSPGSYKSFIALEWAYQVALQGNPVVYCILEGGAGFAKRVMAYRKYHDLQPTDLFCLLSYIGSPLDNEVLGDFTAVLATKRPALIVLDTLAMASIGIMTDENDSIQTSNFLSRCKSLYPGASILLIHHNRKMDDEYRGSTGLEGGVDVRLSVKRDESREGLAIVTGRKNKDGIELARTAYQMRIVDLEAAADYTDAISSLVAERQDEVPRPRKGADNRMDVLRAIMQGNDTRKGIQDSLDMPYPTVTSHVKALVKNDFVCISGKQGRADLYAVTRSGRDRLISHDGDVVDHAESQQSLLFSANGHQ